MINLNRFLDWVDTHTINPNSKYYNGHLNEENHKNVMNCTYYIVFEQNYKQILWWKNKKERIQKQIETNDTKQMEVRKHLFHNNNNSMDYQK